jgi:hopanoid biosynthesis associated protein HpnK
VAKLRLIIHADDFGLSEQINNGIRHAYLDGILTATSIMATGSAFEHGIDICRSTPDLDLGVHLTLVEEKPLLNGYTISSLVDNSGKFYKNAKVFVRRYLSGKIRLAELRRELDAQIRRVLDCGVSVSHLDSHQHLHLLPGIWRIVIELAKKYTIPYVRRPREQPRLYMLRERLGATRLASLLVLNVFCFLAKSKDIMSTEHFVGFFFGGVLNKGNMNVLLRHLPEQGTCELMCHPGLHDPSSVYDHWNYHWSEELEALQDSSVSRFFENEGILLISYRDLSAT